MKPTKKSILFIFFLGYFTISCFSQKEKINWISFEQLEDSLSIKPKKVLISFYADWCAYCKKMNKVAFKNNEVIKLINKEYYAVKMNSESKKTIHFEGKKYYNKQVGKNRNPIHEIPLLLASRKEKSFSLPATIILNKNFEVIDRYFEYLSTKKMAQVLSSK